MFNTRTIHAVPYKPPNVDTEMAAPTSVKFCRINARLSYIDTASDTTAGPNRNNNTSPGPTDVVKPSRPVLYDNKMDRKLMFVALILVSSAMAVHVNAVQVTNGWTNCLKELGNRAPNTNVCNVVNNKNDFTMTTLATVEAFVTILPTPVLAIPRHSM